MLTICITTDKSFARHSSIFNFHRQFTELLPKSNNLTSAGNVDGQTFEPHGLHFVNDFKNNQLLHLIEDGYQSNLWDQHIWEGSYIFTLNALNAIRNTTFEENLGKFGLCSFAKDSFVQSIFPSRSLSQPEHDVLNKHYYALQVASLQNEWTLIIEDDACLGRFLNQHLIKESIPRWLNKGTSGLGYEDLCQYKCYLDNHKNKSKPHILNLGIAMTRTLCAYLVSPRTAHILFSDYLPYSLPADLHMQRLLIKHRIPGYLWFPGLIRNGSKTGNFQSAI